MATNTTSHHLAPPPSTIGHMNSTERVRDELAPPTGSRQRGPPSPRAQSKSILTTALQKAQTAVQFDSANNVVAALNAYKQTVELLSQVIDKAVNDADRRRLQLIHDTYADRIRLLSTIAPESSDNKDNDEVSTSSEPNNSDTSTRHSADSGVNVNSHYREDSIGQKSISEGYINESSTLQDNESKLTERESSSSPYVQQNVDAKTDNSCNDETRLTKGDTLTNGTNHHNDRESIRSIRSDTVDHMTAQYKRLSNTSTSTSKSWISTKSHASDRTTQASITSIYEISTKPITDSGEHTPRSSDLDSNSEDVDVISKTVNGFSQNFDSHDVDSENTEKNLNNQSQDSSQQKQENHLTTTSQNNPSLLRASSPASNRLFVPPPPPKIAPPSSPISQLGAPEFNPNLLSSPPDKSALTGRRSTSPTIVPPPSVIKQSAASQVSSHGSPTQTLPDDEDDKASVKSVPNAFTRSSSPLPQNHMEKLVNKTIPQSRRPAPLPLTQQQNYNSRIIPSRSPSNPNLMVNQNDNSATTPRRTASNPGHTPKKSGSVSSRLFNSSQQNSSQTPTSPWVNSFSIISPPLGSPGFGPPTGRMETPSIAKSNSAGYSDCLFNPFQNTSFYDEDIMLFDNGSPDPPPIDLRLRPFWLMKLLERTMTTGGYLTPKLFIPRHLWLQGHVKLAAIDSKISSCEVVSNCLEKLAKTSFNDMDNLAKELEGIEPILEGLQNSLARKLNFVESTNGKSRQSASSLMSWGSKLSRGLDRMGMGNAMVRTEETSSYIDVLLKVFQHAKVVENYIQYFSSLKKPLHLHHHKQIIVRLNKFADFFGNVICRFVLRDLGILTDKYLKKGSHWIVE